MSFLKIFAKITTMLEKKKLNQIKKYFSQQPDITTVYLYGSEVSGKSSKVEKKRDIDFAVLFNQKQNSFKRRSQIASQLQNFIAGKEVDCREINLHTSSPVYLMSVLQKGKLLYSANEGRRIDFEVKVMREYEDTQKLRDLQYFYLKKRLKKGKYGSAE